MKVTGPVSYSKYSFRGRIIKLFGDLHNSTEDGCECVGCLDYDNQYNKIGNNDKCYSISRYIDKLLTHHKNINFYLETPFVTHSSLPINPPGYDNLDSIDRMNIVFARSLTRDKSQSPYMPDAKVHYIDIRDSYVTPYSKTNNLRMPQSCNPFSGKWLKNQLLTHQDYINGYHKLKKILDNSDKIFDIFMGSYQMPEIDIDDSWQKCLESTRLITSVYNGNRVHRVRKQLLKLDPTTRSEIIEWAYDRFRRERTAGYHRLETWKMFVDRRDYQNADTSMVLIPISGVLMDTYTLARILYQPGDAVVFTGKAHYDNYRSFFDRYDGKLLKDSEREDGKLRCVGL